MMYRKLNNSLITMISKELDISSKTLLKLSINELLQLCDKHDYIINIFLADKHNNQRSFKDDILNSGAINLKIKYSKGREGCYSDRLYCTLCHTLWEWDYNILSSLTKRQTQLTPINASHLMYRLHDKKMWELDYYDLKLDRTIIDKEVVKDIEELGWKLVEN